MTEPKADDMRHLAGGAKAHCTVAAQSLWNPSGIFVHAGERYQLRVTDVRNWRDGWVDAGPEGHFNVPWYLNNLLARRFLRCPSAQWYALIAAVGHDAIGGVAVGWNAILDVAHSGELGFFANDAPFAYGNNHGTLTVEIHRLHVAAQAS